NGECWCIGAHVNGQSVVKNGNYKRKTLGELWDKHRYLFGGIDGEQFPLLVKIIDANQDLSVQVHPGDEYAKIHENGELGKTECWYILECKEDGDIIYGTRAKNNKELNEMIDNGQWSKLLRSTAIKKGDFFYIPSGTVHALKAGTLILEIQQNSDTTYRLYDYDRRDEEGNLRELHIEKSKDVIEVPFVERQARPELIEKDNFIRTKFIESPHFTVEKYDIKKEIVTENNHPFVLMSIIKGKGRIIVDRRIYPIIKG